MFATQPDQRYALFSALVSNSYLRHRSAVLEPELAGLL